MEELGLDFSTFILTLINFAILVVILKHFLWDKIKVAIEEREEYIENTISKAEDDSHKARLYLVENERILSASKDEGNKIIEEKKLKADAIYDEIIENANKEAKNIIERAKVEINREKEKAEYELKRQVVDLAIDISTKALEEKVEDKTQRDLINDFITKVGN